jgi:hypothetical protein
MIESLVAAYMRVSALNMFHFLYYANVVLITHSTIWW